MTEQEKIDRINNFQSSMSKKDLEELEDMVKNPEKYRHPACCHCQRCVMIRRCLNIEFK